jgi:hypothetical protein
LPQLEFILDAFKSIKTHLNEICKSTPKWFPKIRNVQNCTRPKICLTVNNRGKYNRQRNIIWSDSQVGRPDTLLYIYDKGSVDSFQHQYMTTCINIWLYVITYLPGNNDITCCPCLPVHSTCTGIVNCLSTGLYVTVRRWWVKAYYGIFPFVQIKRWTRLINTRY